MHMSSNSKTFILRAASMLSLLLCPCVYAEDNSAKQLKPLDVVKLTAYATGEAIQSADLQGTYESFNEDGTTWAEAAVRIRFSGDEFLVEIDPKKGFRYDRIVAVADESGVCEATFSPRMNPTGCHVPNGASKAQWQNQNRRRTFVATRRPHPSLVARAACILPRA